MIRQQLDNGCAAASLATILTYHFDFPSTEEEMLQPLLAAALKDAEPDVRGIGFSLRHIRDVATKGGLAAAAFRVEEKNLGRIQIPAIVRITIHGYNHFAVFKETRNGRVYLADPAFGNTSYRLRSFAKLWSGVMMGFSRRAGQRPLDHLLVVRPEDERVIASEEIIRLAAARELAPRPSTGPQFYNISTFPYLPGPRVPGLRSVYPFIMGNRIEF